MAASDKLFVVHLEERVGGGEELGMEDHLCVCVCVCVTWCMCRVWAH